MEGCLKLHEHNDYFSEYGIVICDAPKGHIPYCGTKTLGRFFILESSSFDAQICLKNINVCLLLVCFRTVRIQTRLPKLLPLIDSKYERVRNILMGQLGPYLDDYMGHVINALNKLKLESKYVDVIKQYYEREERMHWKRETKHERIVTQI